MNLRLFNGQNLTLIHFNFDFSIIDTIVYDISLLEIWKPLQLDKN